MNSATMFDLVARAVSTMDSVYRTKLRQLLTGFERPDYLAEEVYLQQRLAFTQRQLTAPVSPQAPIMEFERPDYLAEAVYLQQRLAFVQRQLTAAPAVLTTPPVVLTTPPVVPTPPAVKVPSAMRVAASLAGLKTRENNQNQISALFFAQALMDNRPQVMTVTAITEYVIHTLNYKTPNPDGLSSGVSVALKNLTLSTRYRKIKQRRFLEKVGTGKWMYKDTSQLPIPFLANYVLPGTVPAVPPVTASPVAAVSLPAVTSAIADVSSIVDQLREQLSGLPVSNAPTH